MSFTTRARRAALTLAATSTAALALIAPAAASVPASASRTQSAAAPSASSGGGIGYQHACPAPTWHHAACLAIMDTSMAGRPLSRAAAATVGLHAYMAADLQAAYALPSAQRGKNQTIAIVDAFNDPNAEADLAVYRKTNKLPACTTANGCFKKVNQKGQQRNYPPTDDGWALEESLDLDMASAICPHCKIILAEASTNFDSDLFPTEDEAARLGANVISDSWGEPEFGVSSSPAANCAEHFSHPGVAITASSGDSGFGVIFPSSCQSVTAVGGTTLFQASNARGWGELAWAGAGSGCSGYIAKPAWQHDRLCGKRTVADVSAVADPNTPVAVYDTTDLTGWVTVGGTSVAAPVIAGVYALAGNAATITPGSWLYAHHKDLNDVVSGSNGTCGGSYLCTAVKAYDGPTGLGTPHGTGAF
jgi:subtilase family serine protease